MEQVSDDELDHAAEEDSDKEDQDLDKMFGAWLGELDKLTQVTLSHSMWCIISLIWCIIFTLCAFFWKYLYMQFIWLM